jgi:hypothetical protein
MQKIINGCFSTIVSVAIASTLSAYSVNAQTTGEYLDSSSPQTIEKISGNIVTFKDVKGESRNYYVPDWMFSNYNLKVGSAMNLYNRNVIQGIFRGSYIEIVSQGLPENMGAFAIHETRQRCTIEQSPASAGLASGKRVWYKSVCCPSTIPVVGAMWSYQAKEIVSIEPSIRQTIPPAVPTPPPVTIERPTPVQGLW